MAEGVAEGVLSCLRMDSGVGARQSSRPRVGESGLIKGSTCGTWRNDTRFLVLGPSWGQPKDGSGEDMRVETGDQERSEPVEERRLGMGDELREETGGDDFSARREAAR